MKTPKRFTDNLKNRVITEEMLELCLFSVNKRAKNCRDKERDYRNTEYEDSYRDSKYSYYGKKDKLLTLLSPTIIHYEYKTLYHYWGKEDSTLYYLFYQIGNHSFHRPIQHCELKDYPDLQQKDIGELITYGKEVSDLISVQFVDKVLKLISDGDFEYISAA